MMQNWYWFSRIKDMADYLDTVVEEDKLEMVKNGLEDILFFTYSAAFISGIIFGSIFIMIVKCLMVRGIVP